MNSHWLTTCALALFPLAALSPSIAWAQTLEGVYAVSGSEPGRGPYSGRVELRRSAAGYDFVRDVEYATFSQQGRPVSTVWAGQARDMPGGVQVTLELDRMGWASGGAGLTRTAADGVPMTIQGVFSSAGARDLQGGYLGQGAPFVDPNERWTYLGPVAASPIWRNQRVRAATHQAPARWLRQILDAVFRSFRQTAWIRPYLQNPDFVAGIHDYLHDATDFALHRQRPRLLRVVQRLLDPLSLAEAEVKADAFGKTLAQKAAEADREVPQRFLDAGMLSGLRAQGGFVPDGDSAEWTGLYALSQAYRHMATGAPAALQNLRLIVAAEVQLVDITGQPGEFARTLRASTATPASGIWHRGQGPHAGVDWMEGGNNDMLKGLLVTGIAALEALPPGDPQTREMARVLSSLWRHSSVVQDGKFNEQNTAGVVSAINGPGPERDRYDKIRRNPFLNLYTVAQAGGVYYYGISDWSGAQLELNTLLVRARLAELHGKRISSLINKLGLRRAAQRQRKVRRVTHDLVAAGLARLPWPWSRYDPSNAIWVLRETPYPRTGLSSHRALRADVSASPYPELPWKRDWVQGRNRARAIVAPPLYEVPLGNYYWKSNPFPALDGEGGGLDWSGTDYLFAYWLGRAYGVIGPND